ncbi:MAG: LysE/ArgO family amino acid transporter [Polaromonas sp.]
MNLFTAPAFFAGLVLSLSLIMAIGPQNAHVMRMGLQRQHLWLTIAVCVATDIALIAAGVAGLAQLGGLSDKLLGAMTGAGALVLLLYGGQAMRRFLQPRPQPALDAGSAPGTPGQVSRRRAMALALALSWLNPHAWLDTAVVIGTASLAYAQPDNAVFGLGAAAGSLLWFSALGLAMGCLGRRLNSPRIWRALDGLVALTMGGTALWLLAGLF